MTGLAQSFQLPDGESSVVIPDEQRHGKYAFQPPEVYRRLSYNIYQCDLWATTLTFFFLLTHECLDENADPSNLAFQSFIQHRGITGVENNSIISCINDADLADKESYDETNRDECDRIQKAQLVRTVFRKIQRLSPELPEMLSHLLKHDPKDRRDIEYARAEVARLITAAYR